MTFEDSKYFKQLKHTKIELTFGTFYLFDTFMISELNEGIHFSWKKVEQLAEALVTHYGTEIKIGYISNRVNSYSFEPQRWIDFNKTYGFIVATAIVTYSGFNYMNATIEKRLSGHSLKRCKSLDIAINWMLNLREFN
jgi:hypothetical protein